MAQYESSVQVGEFSKKSLDQLKKTFAPTLESIFEARQKAGDAGGESAKQIKESLGLFGLLGKALKNIIKTMLGFTLALAALSLAFNVEMKSMFAQLAAFSDLLKKFFGKDDKIPKTTKAKPGWWAKRMAQWATLTDDIKKNDMIKQLSKKWIMYWAAFKEALIPFKELFGVEEGPKAAKGEDKGWKQFKDFFERVSKWKWVKFMGWMLPGLFRWYTAIKAFLDAKEAGAKNRAKQGLAPGEFGTFTQEFDTLFVELGAALESLIQSWIGDYFMGLGGTILEYTNKWLLKPMGLDALNADGSADIFGVHIPAGENWGEAFSAAFKKWRHEKYDWFDKWLIHNFASPEEGGRTDGLDWADDIDKWMAEVSSKMWEWVKGKFLAVGKAIIPEMWWPDDWHGEGGSPKKQFGSTNSPLAPSKTYEDRTFGSPDAFDMGGGLGLGGLGDAASDLGGNVWSEMQSELGGIGSSFKKGFRSLFGLDKAKTIPKKKEAWNVLNGKVLTNRPIGDDGGTTKMGGVEWNQLSSKGRMGIENAIWGIYDDAGAKVPPVFTSGLRDKNHPNYKRGSKHSEGFAFDLRSKDLGGSFGAIKAGLEKTFNREDGWFMQFEKAGDYNARTGSTASADHFHMQAAARGYHDWVTRPTWFLAGEAGPERVDILPLKDPMNQTQAMRNMGADISGGGMVGQMGGITTVVDASSNTSNATVLAVGNGPHPAPIDDGLHWYSPHR